MNSYYQFDIFIVDDDSEDAKECKKVMKMLNEYGHHFTARDVTAAKDHYLKEFSERHDQKNFPYVFCEGQDMVVKPPLVGFLKMLAMSPCFRETDNDYDLILLKKE